MNHIVVLICGIPGSGKSTITACLRDSLISGDRGISNLSPALQTNLDVRIISFDDVHRHEVLKDTRCAALATLDSLLSEGASGDASLISREIAARVIIVDDVMEYGSMRREVYTRARNAMAHYIVVWVRCDLIVALQRDAAREGAAHIGESVIRKIADRFEPMNMKDIWDRNFIEIDANDSIKYHSDIQRLESTIAAVCAGRENRYKLTSASQDQDVRTLEICSPAHDLDNSLRKAISEIIQGLKGTSKGKAGSLLSAAKRRVLEDPKLLRDSPYREPTELLRDALRDMVADSESTGAVDPDLVNNILIALQKLQSLRIL